MPHSVEMPAPVKGTMAGGLGDHVAELFHAAAKIGCDHGMTSESLAVLTIARPVG